MGEEAAPTTRKSQIIEEEEDVEDIEEVDTFGGPADAMNLQDSFSSPVDVTAADMKPDESDKPGLAPPPELDSSPGRPPRSSSLRASQPEADDKDNTDSKSVVSAK